MTVIVSLLACFAVVVSGTEPVCEFADGCEDATSLLALRGVHQHVATGTVEQCCYHQCGRCNPPDHECSADKHTCQLPQKKGGCNGTFLVCPGEPVPVPTPTPTEVQQCCYDTCGSCNPAEHQCSASADACGHCHGQFLSCPVTGLLEEQVLVEEHRKETKNPASGEEVEQCCYDACGSCNPPDHDYCNAKGVCERAQEDDGGCAGTWLSCPKTALLITEKVEHRADYSKNTTSVGQCCYDQCGQCNPPDHEYCNAKEVCERSQDDDGGCAGTWLECPEKPEPPAPTPASGDEVEQCCYDACGSCNPPDHDYCNAKGVCERAQEDDGGCAGTWLSCPK